MSRKLLPLSLNYLDLNYIVEFVLLGLAAPILYFSERFPPAFIALALALLASTWLWRYWRLGAWVGRTPVDTAVLFLFLVMLPIAVWAAPPALRDQYTWPKAYVLIWNLCLFYTVTAHARRNKPLFFFTLSGFFAAGLLIGFLAPWGTTWIHKLPGSQLILSQMPAILTNWSREGPSGFHPNMVAGALLYVLPLLLAVSWRLLRHPAHPALRGATLLSTLCLGLVFLLLQSRGGIIGLSAAVVTMSLLPYRWGRWTLVAVSVFLALITPFLFQDLMCLIGDTPTAAALGGIGTLEGFRLHLWQTAINAIQDFPFTGSGLGAFQEIAHLLYPVNISPSYYFGHAHNFWLQVAIDFGIPGLLAIGAIYLAAIFASYRWWKNTPQPLERSIGLGSFGVLIAHLVYGITDSISMGSTPNFLFWYLLALIFSARPLLITHNGSLQPVDAPQPVPFHTNPNTAAQPATDNTD